MAEAEKAYLFRPHVQDDLNFIKSSWASSYYKGCNYQDLLSPEEFHAYHRPIREKILNRPNTAIIVCASKIGDSKTDLIGWVLVEMVKCEKFMPILHYLYVKKIFKGEGIARELLKASLNEHSPVMFTHMTEKAYKILNKKQMKDFYFTPHLL